MTEGKLLYFASSFIGSVQEIGQLSRSEVAQWLLEFVENVRFELRSGGRRSLPERSVRFPDYFDYY